MEAFPVENPALPGVSRPSSSGDDNHYKGSTGQEGIINKHTPDHTSALLSQNHEETSLLLPKSEQAEAYPDGGLRAWGVVLGSFCATFAGIAMVNSSGAYQSWISLNELRNVDPGPIGWIFSFHNFCTFFGGLFVGPVFDAKGPQRLSIIGGGLVLLMYLGLGLCKTYWEFLFCIGVVGGGGAALLFTCAISSVQHWFLVRRGLATGITISGGSFGGIVFPLVLERLLPAIGFAWTTRLIALILLPFVCGAMILMKSRFSKTHEGLNLPKLSILRHLRVVVMGMGLLSIELGIYIPVTYITSYALDHEISSQVAYRLITYMNAGSLMGRWLPAAIGDKIGALNMQVLALGATVLSVFGMWLPARSSEAAVVAFSLVYGLTTGSIISLAPVCVSRLCKIEEYGQYFSTLYALSSLGYVDPFVDEENSANFSAQVFDWNSCCWHDTKG